ncbi:hypothetical protein ACS0TY_032599 [Phlomoides rotata]
MRRTHRCMPRHGRRHRHAFNCPKLPGNFIAVLTFAARPPTFLFSVLRQWHVFLAAPPYFSVTFDYFQGRFEDVRKPPTLLSKTPRDKKELDENKSKKGLAELYEDEYAQKTGLVSTAMTFSDEQKKEASLLFKKLCVKLDALSHFHFTPKPVAPLAVSDEAMLAPGEVFAGKGDIKEETELTKTERKRRRAKKKRQFKDEILLMFM